MAGYVIRKHVRDPLVPTPVDLTGVAKSSAAGATRPSSVLIIGAGAAGSAAAEMLGEWDTTTESR